MTITGCGALSQAVDCNTAAAEVTTIMNEFNTTAASAATDPKALETAGKEAGAKVKTLAKQLRRGGRRRAQRPRHRPGRHQDRRLRPGGLDGVGQQAAGLHHQDPAGLQLIRERFRGQSPTAPRSRHVGVAALGEASRAAIARSQDPRKSA
ncbi:hypothetical protein ACFSTC_08990 [Nonomuraea ferruginea]